jgi:predicted permease
MSTVREAIAIIAFRYALLAFPGAHRSRFGAEMISDFRTLLRSRRQRRGALTMRAVWDALQAGVAERLRVAHAGPGSGRAPRRGDGPMQELWIDLLRGGRRLRHAPGFAAAAIAMLALGIGANTAVFSALKTVLLSPPPFPEHERLVWLRMSSGPAPAEMSAFPWSWAKFRILQENSAGALEAVAGYGTRNITITGDGSDGARLSVEVVTARYFDVLGRAPIVGRVFEVNEVEDAAAPLVVVLGHALWRERFGGDRSVVGRTINLNDQPVQVVGVGPAGFEGLSGSAQAWIPVATAGQIISPVMVRGAQAHWLWGFGRLANGVEPASAADRLAGVARAIEETYPDEQGSSVGVDVSTLAAARSNETSRVAVLVLMAAAAMVLLIGCANLAGLLLARSRGFARDAAIRLALGAGRARVVRAALAESVVLALLGGIAALLVAHWSLIGLRALWPERFTLSGDTPLQSVDLATLHLDAGALLFALAISLLTGVLFGLVPALRQAGVGVQATLRDGAGTTRRRSRRRGLPATSSTLVTIQTALALVLLIGAGLMLGTLVQLRSVDAGFDFENVLVMDASVSRANPAWRNPAPLHDALIERVAALPGVEAATLGCAPLNVPCWRGVVTGVDGRAQGLDNVMIGIHMVPDGFFDALRIPLRAGRTFEASDREGGPPVVILNESAARDIFGSTNALGRRVALSVDVTTENQAEVIGIVGDVVQGRAADGTMAEAYFSHRQMAEAGGGFMVRTTGEPLDMVGPIRAAVRELDPTVVLDGVRTMESARRESLGETRIVLVLLGLFATVALALAGAGIWAVVALAVAERRRELGLRIALGARAGQLVQMVVRQGVGATLLGAVLGTWAAWLLSRLLSNLLFETSTHDVRIFGGAAALLVIAALAASLLPARNVMRVDPASTLRDG